MFGNFYLVSKSALSSQSVTNDSAFSVGFSFSLDFTPNKPFQIFLVIWCICTDCRTYSLHYFF